MLLGCIGKDSYGDKIVEGLNKAGVKPLLEVRDDFKSSRCGVAIHNKERCLLPEIRASTMLSMDFVQKNLDTISQASMLLIEGYFVIEKYDIIHFLAEHFNKLNKKIAFTLSATFMLENFGDRMLEVANKSHLIFCNNEEAEVFSKLTGSKCYEEMSAAIHKKLTPLAGRLLVITCGKDPVFVSSYDYKEDRVDFVLKSFVHPVSNEEIVDTNGCGDSFVGGFLAQYIQGHSLEKCTRAGNWASSVIIRNVGCTYPDVIEKKQF
jgi:adenosine kinase